MFPNAPDIYLLHYKIESEENLSYNLNNYNTRNDLHLLKWQRFSFLYLIIRKTKRNDVT